MSTVYVIVKEFSVRGGHDNNNYTRLATTGCIYPHGEPLPVFKNRNAAELERNKFDDWDFFKVIPLDLIEEDTQ